MSLARRQTLRQLGYAGTHLTSAHHRPHTPYPSEYFDVIACLSVIEHRVSIERFLKESHRILRPGGFLIISTDYWKNHINIDGKEAYGTEVKILTQQGIQEMIERASSIGFMPTGEIDYSTKEKAVHWKRLELDFTFIVFTLVKVEDRDRRENYLKFWKTSP